MVLRYEDMMGPGGSTAGPMQPGGQPPPSVADPTPGETSPGNAPPAASAPGAGEPVGPGLQGPYFAPGSGNDASAGLSYLDEGRPRGNVPKFDEAFFGQLRGGLQGVISGRDVPFSQQVIRGLKGSAWAQAKDAGAAGARASDQDALRRGIFRSGNAANNAAAARSAADRSAVAATTGIDATAAQANFNARMGAIAQGKTLLDQLAERIARAEALGQDVAKAKAQLAFGYDQIASAERQQHNDLNAALERQLIGSTMGA